MSIFTSNCIDGGKCSIKDEEIIMIITCKYKDDTAILAAMAKLEQVEPIALMPTQGGCAVFLGNGNKVIYFFIDPSIGASINGVLAQQAPERPLTHDLYMMTLESFGAKVLRVIIVGMADEVYFARVIFQAENELQEKKIVELDARPSDCIALAVRAHCPIYVVADLWERLPDVSSTLEEMRKATEESE